MAQVGLAPVMVAGTDGEVNHPLTVVPVMFTCRSASAKVCTVTKLEALLLLVEQLPLSSHTWAKNSASAKAVGTTAPPVQCVGWVGSNGTPVTTRSTLRHKWAPRPLNSTTTRFAVLSVATSKPAVCVEPASTKAPRVVEIVGGSK